MNLCGQNGYRRHGYRQNGYRRGGGRRKSAKHGRAKISAARKRTAPTRPRYRRETETGRNHDYHSRLGAEVLARQIENYWRSLGFNVRTWLVSFEQETDAPAGGNVNNSGRRGALWMVRSSLANGLPPGRGNPFYGAQRQAVVRARRSGSRFTADCMPAPPSAAVEISTAADGLERRTRTDPVASAGQLAK